MILCLRSVHLLYHSDFVLHSSVDSANMLVLVMMIFPILVICSRFLGLPWCSVIISYLCIMLNTSAMGSVYIYLWLVVDW